MFPSLRCSQWDSGNKGEERTSVDDIIGPGFSRAAYTRFLAFVRSHRIDERCYCWLGTDSVKEGIKYKNSPFIIVLSELSESYHHALPSDFKPNDPAQLPVPVSFARVEQYFI
jgi:hypothetical protein